MKRMIQFILTLVLILNSHAAYAIPVIYFTTESETIVDGVIISKGYYESDNHTKISKSVPQAVVIFPDGSAELGVYSEATNQIVLVEPVKVSKDGKSVESSFSLPPGTSIDNPSERTKGAGSNNSNGNGSVGGNSGGILSATIKSGISSGLFTAGEMFVMGLALSGESAQNSAKLAHEISEISNYNANLLNLNVQVQNKMLVDFFRNNKILNDTKIDLNYDDYQFKTQETKQLNDLKLNRTVLSSAFSFDPVERFAKKQGLEFNREADEAYASGDQVAGDGYLKYARAFADIAVGIDPITGTIRSTYEAFSGLNMITGEELSDVERAFAIAGVVSFGFGSKIQKGFQVLQKTKLSQAFAKNFDKAINLAQKLTAKSKVVLHSDYRSAYNASKSARAFLNEIISNSPEDVGKYVQLINETKDTAFRANSTIAEQAFTKEALDIYSDVKSGRKIYRLGNSGKSGILNSAYTPQYWAAKKENLALPFEEYMDKMGGYSVDCDFIQTAKYTGKGKFVVRPAPEGDLSKIGLPGKTKGGELEVVMESVEGLRPLEAIDFEKFNSADLDTVEERIDFFGKFFDSN